MCSLPEKKHGSRHLHQQQQEEPQIRSSSCGTSSSRVQLPYSSSGSIKEGSKVVLREPSAVDRCIYANYVKIGRQGYCIVSPTRQKQYREYVTMEHIIVAKNKSEDNCAESSSAKCSEKESSTMNGFSEKPSAATGEQQPIWVKRDPNSSMVNSKSFSTDV